MLVRPGPGYCVCLCTKTSTMWAVNSPTMMAGSSRMCTEKRSGMICSPGNGPPKTMTVMYDPMIGIDRMKPSAARRPVPESRSSGSE